MSKRKEIQDLLDVRDANARLIAAAPDLLEALLAVRNEIPAKFISSALASTIDLLITKATGGVKSKQIKFVWTYKYRTEKHGKVTIDGRVVGSAFYKLEYVSSLRMTRSRYDVRLNDGTEFSSRKSLGISKLVLKHLKL